MQHPATYPPSDRRSAVLTGVFFIIATAFLFAGEAIYKPILDASNVLEIAAERRTAIVAGLLVEFICVLAIPMIAVVIYPVLCRFSTPVALAYLFLRSLEAVVLIAVALINKLSLIGLSEAYIANPAARAQFEAIHAGWLAQNAWSDTSGLLYNLIFACGALLLYIALFRSRLIPRVLSLWGIVSIGILAATVLAVALAAVEVPPLVTVLLIGPLAVQEMAMALWLILRGFDPAALKRLPA